MGIYLCALAPAVKRGPVPTGQTLYIRILKNRKLEKLYCSSDSSPSVKPIPTLPLKYSHFATIYLWVLRQKLARILYYYEYGCTPFHTPVFLYCKLAKYVFQARHPECYHWR